MERIVSAVKGNPYRENIMKVWTDYTIDDTIIGCCIKSHVSHQGWSYKLLLEKIMSRCCTWHHRTCDRTKETIKDTVDMTKKKSGGWYWNVSRYEIQELTDTTSEELIEPDLMEMNASKPGPDTEEQDVEESVWENKSILDNLTEQVLFKTALTSFTTWTLLWFGHWNQSKWWQKCWYYIETFLENWKSERFRQKLQCICIN